MTEATAVLTVEMRVRDLVTRRLDSTTKKLKSIGQVGLRAFVALSGAVSRFARNGLQQINRFVSSAAQRLKSLAKISLLGGAAASIGFGQSFAKEAAFFEESAAKFRAVFKGASDSAVRDLLRIRKSTGATTVDLTKYFSTLQDTFVPLGIATDEAARLSAKLTQLGIDLASFNAKSQEDVINDLTSALVGQSRAVQKYGIVINEQRIANEAYATGLARVGEELTEQQKVYARLSILFKSTKDAQGDAARTIDSTANTFRNIAGGFKELKVVFGRELIFNIRRIIDELGGVDGVLDILKVGMALITRAANALIDVFGRMAKGAKFVIDSFGDADSLANVLSGRFERMGRQGVAAAKGIEAVTSAVFGLPVSSELSRRLEFGVQFPLEDTARAFKETFKKFITAAGKTVYEGAKLLALIFARGFLEVFQSIRIPNPFGKDIALVTERDLASANAKIAFQAIKLKATAGEIGAAFSDLKDDLFLAFAQVRSIAGNVEIDAFDALVPTRQLSEELVAAYEQVGKKSSEALATSLQQGATAATLAARIAIVSAVRGVTEDIAQRQIAAATAVKAAQVALTQAIASPGVIIASEDAGRAQWDAYEQSIIDGIATSGARSRIEVFFEQEQRAIAEKARREFRAAGQRITYDNREPTEAYLERVRELTQEFQSSGRAATTAFSAGIADATDALGSLADQAANAGQAVVFGLRDSLSGAFQGFITGAEKAGDAWDTFRDRFKNVLAQIVSDILASRITKLLASLFGGPSAAQATVLNTVFGTSFAHGGVMKGEMGKPVPVRAYAEGGIARSPQLALFGEGRGAEAFVPLKNGSIPVEVNGGASGTNVSVNLTVNSLDPRTAGSVILEQMPTIRAALADALQSGQDRNLRIAIQGAK